VGHARLPGARPCVAVMSLALVLVSSGAAGSYASARAPRRVGSSSALASSDPPPTSMPTSPGITLASSDEMDMPDPFLLDADGKYFLYLSTSFGDRTHSNVPVLTGRPGDWGPVSDALPELPAWARPSSTSDLVWAPDVVRNGSKYLMYFSPIVNQALDPRFSHCIGVAVASAPAGPFVPVSGPPLVCQLVLGGDIDAQFFKDPDGPNGPAHPNYLIWKSDNNNLPGTGPTTIWAQALSDDGLETRGTPMPIFAPAERWEWPEVEAPQLVSAPNGSDWLFFSAGRGFWSPDYGVGAVECEGPLGGCFETRTSPLVASNSQGPGPGEETVFDGPHGSTWILYNPWFAGGVAPLRPVEAVRIGWNAIGPYVADAGRFPLPRS